MAIPPIVFTFNQTTAFGDNYDVQGGTGSTVGDDKLTSEEFVLYCQSLGMDAEIASFLFNAGDKNRDGFIVGSEFLDAAGGAAFLDEGSVEPFRARSTLFRLAAAVGVSEAAMLNLINGIDATEISSTIRLSAQLNTQSAVMTQLLKLFGVMSEKLESAAAPRA